MEQKSSENWSTKLASLGALQSITWAGKIAPFEVPKPGTFIEVQGRRFLVTRSGGVDGIVLGVASRRSSCLVAVEMPGEAALIVVADSPAMLETVVSDVFAVLGPSHVIVSP